MVDSIRLGLIGKALKHSYSPALFNEIFRAEKVVGKYELFSLASIEQLPEMIQANPTLSGFNVTVPYKEHIIPYLDDVTEEAKKSGSVNTVFIEHSESGKNGEYRLIGHSTDGIGFVKSIAGIINNVSTTIILGTGGAAKAISRALINEHIKVIMITRQRLDDFLRDVEILNYNDINPRIVDETQLIVNATPVGMWPDIDNCPPFPMNMIDSRHYCYDLIYNPAITQFISKSMSRGAWTKNGLEMLKMQAIEAWKFWKYNIEL